MRRLDCDPPKGSSSIGRAPVSKTGGCRFESCLPCLALRSGVGIPSERERMFGCMPRTRSLEDVRAVFALKARGMTDREVSQGTGVPVNTIRLWRNRQVPWCARAGVLHEGRPRDDTPPDLASLPREAYAYLLGMYLGDGWLSRNGSSWMLRIALDEAYQGIVAECERALREVSQDGPLFARREGPTAWSSAQRGIHGRSCSPSTVRGGSTTAGLNLPTGSRRSSRRPHSASCEASSTSDGWRGLNRVYAKGKRYEYPRYQFSNRSDDIRKLFTDVCDRLDVEWRQWTRYHVSVARRKSVAYPRRVHRPQVLAEGPDMRAEGLEPPRALAHEDLNLARLPVPPRPRRSADSRPGTAAFAPLELVCSATCRSGRW